MKKILILSVVVLAFLAGCGETGLGIPVSGVTLNKDTASIAIGATETLTATISPENASVKTVEWSSSSDNIATVSDTGAVAGVASGTATITVTTIDGEFSDSCEVTVTSLTLSPSGFDMRMKTDLGYVSISGTSILNLSGATVASVEQEAEFNNQATTISSLGNVLDWRTIGSYTFLRHEDGTVYYTTDNSTVTNLNTLLGVADVYFYQIQEVFGSTFIGTSDGLYELVALDPFEVNLVASVVGVVNDSTGYNSEALMYAVLSANSVMVWSNLTNGGTEWHEKTFEKSGNSWNVTTTDTYNYCKRSIIP